MTRNLLYSIIIILISACQAEEAMDDISCLSSVEFSKLQGYNIKEKVVLDNLNLSCILEKVITDTFLIKNKTEEIPNFINECINDIHSGHLNLANPNEPWQSGCTPPIMSVSDYNENEIGSSNKIKTAEVGRIEELGFPMRQLIEFRLGNSTAVLLYRSGGFAGNNHILIFEYQDSLINDFWMYNPKDEIMEGDPIYNIKIKHDKSELSSKERFNF
ncbi:MAG: hypothetical protein COA32_17505 [Fluviicola sp.]|nr:MAG: hypothetical protein COA32_17505 [Fluviicola sp.]